MKSIFVVLMVLTISLINARTIRDGRFIDEETREVASEETRGIPREEARNVARNSFRDVLKLPEKRACKGRGHFCNTGVCCPGLWCVFSRPADFECW